MYTEIRSLIFDIFYSNTSSNLSDFLCDVYANFFCAFTMFLPVFCIFVLVKYILSLFGR